MAAAGFGAFLSVFGLVSDVLGIVQFGLDNFSPPETATSVVRIAVGLDIDGGLSNAGGDLPDVRLFNEAGKFLGLNADPGRIGDGSTVDIKVSHNDDNGQQAPYVLFSANDDAICIAYASITWPNGDKYAWLGDWGRRCGGSWYFSNLFVNGLNSKPDCLWIDANGDQPQTGFQVHFTEFVPTASEIPPDAGALPTLSKSADYLCNSGPPFKLYTDPDPKGITYWTLDPNGPNNKRSVDTTSGYSNSGSSRRERRSSRTKQSLPGGQRHRHSNSTQQASGQARHTGHLVVDNSTDHSAAILCASPSSVGPDFANIAEGRFCRMSDKTLWPVCATDGSAMDNCFDSVTQKLIVGGKVTRDQAYSRVTSWGVSGGSESRKLQRFGR
jgi:hypothetical protein